MTPEYKLRFWSKVDKTPTCWIWTASRTTHGYGQATHPYKKGCPIGAYRAACMMAHGAIDPGLCICHKCDNPLCVRPAHLFAAPQRDNLSDMRRKGRGFTVQPRRGKDNARSKFTNDDVRNIRRLYAQGHSLRVLGRKYGVWHTTISVIVRGKTWVHLK